MKSIFHPLLWCGFALSFASCLATGIGEPDQDQVDQPEPFVPTWTEVGGQCTYPNPARGSAQFVVVPPDAPGSCGNAVLNSGTMTRIGMNFALMENSLLTCGSCVEIAGDSGMISGIITDDCPGCGVNEFELPQSRASQLDPRSFFQFPAVSMSVQWHTIPCPIFGGINMNLAGSTPTHLLVVVSSTRVPVATVALVERGRLQTLHRLPAPRTWELLDGADHGSGPLTFQLTDIFGRSITVGDFLLPATSPVGNYRPTQFPACE